MVKITIEINEQELETLVRDECDCGCDEQAYTQEEMISANLDELNWIKSFMNKWFNDLRYYPSMLNDLEQRVCLGEKIVRELKGQ